MENPARVLHFYNLRRKQLLEALPNKAHQALVRLEKHFSVRIITQNIDDLHERAGSSEVLHLHGELRKAHSTDYPNLVYEITGWELNVGDLCEKGSQLRPHVVWFGEPVPLIMEAAEQVAESDMIIIIGTSMVVYPAAGLVHYARPDVPIFYIDPQPDPVKWLSNITAIPKRATEGVPELVDRLVSELSRP